MRGGRILGRKSLSNIIGAVILIAATIVGGLMVYSYFQRSMGAFMSMGNGVTVTASATPIGNGGELVYIKVINNEPQSITLKEVVFVLSNGTSEDAYIESGNNGYTITTVASTATTTPVPVPLGPSGQLVAVGTTNLSNIQDVYIVYEMGGQTYYTNPMSVTTG